MEYKTKTDLILPFNGTWMVSNGGRTKETNNHLREDGPRHQIYAYDFREEFTGIKDRLEDYEVFGKEVLCPADARIILVKNDSVDINPGEQNKGVGMGNGVGLDFGNGEFGLICHFKFNSITVKEGDRVKQGELIGLCGNSGGSSQPHIHFNLQENPKMKNRKALPAQFRKILVNGELKEEYEPVRFDMVSNP